MQNLKPIFKQYTAFLTLLAVCFAGLACSAKETTATVAAVSDGATVEAAQPQVNSKDSEKLAAAKQKIVEEYAVVMVKASEVVGVTLQNNPKNFVAGAHYDEFETRQSLVGSGDKIEVVEFFSHGCPACFNAEPYMHAYAEQLPEDVVFKRIPVSFNANFEPLARGYYAANALGVEEEAHIALFDAIHVKKRQDLMQNRKSLANFYADYGVDKDKFLKTFDSFFVNTKIDEERRLAKAYRVQAVPTVIVNGAYNTGGTKAGSFGAWFQILDTLVEKEREAKAVAQ